MTGLPKSLCILRLSAIGDVTHVLPVIHTLRQHAPDCQITWVIGKLEHKLLKGLPGVRFIVFDKSAGLRAYRQLRGDLNGERFDVLLHMQVALRANLAAALIRADLKIGYDRARSKDLHGLFINRRIEAISGQHVLDALHSFLGPIGLPAAVDQPVWELPLSDSDRAFAEDHVDSRRLSLCISPVSSHQRRNWAVDRYAAIADHAIEQHDMQVILSGGPSALEREIGDQIIRAMRHADSPRLLDLIGKDTLKQSAALLGRVDLLLAPDTGPMHLANAMGTDVLGLHAASNPRRSGTYRALDWTADRYDEAAQRYRNKPADALPWGTKLEYPGVMDLVSVAEVRAILDRWVATKTSRETDAS